VIYASLWNTRRPTWYVPADGRSGADLQVTDAALAGVHLSGDDALALDEASGFVGARRTIEEEQVRRLGQRLPLPQIRLPFIAEEIGPVALHHLADAFTAQVAGIRT
jgi:hypothetical protein